MVYRLAGSIGGLRNASLTLFARVVERSRRRARGLRDAPRLQAGGGAEATSAALKELDVELGGGASGSSPLTAAQRGGR